MMESFVATAAAAAASASPGIDLNGIIGGGGTAVILGVAYYIAKLIVDKRVPSRSDSHASQELVLDSLSNMVKVMQEEKIQDADRLRAKQARIDELEQNADTDYDRLRDMRAEIVELRDRLAQKDRHIRILVLELRRLGAVVTGIEEQTETGDIEITLNDEDSREIRANYKQETQALTTKENS